MIVNGFSYEKKSPCEWANIVYISAQSMADGVTHTFEYLQKFLPLRAAVIDRLEIDTVEDLKIAEDFLRHNHWNI